MKIEVGKTYKNKAGTVFTIISDRGIKPFPYVGETNDGVVVKFSEDGEPPIRGKDLVVLRKPRWPSTQIFLDKTDYNGELVKEANKL